MEDIERNADLEESRRILLGSDEEETNNKVIMHTNTFPCCRFSL